MSTEPRADDERDRRRRLAVLSQLGQRLLTQPRDDELATRVYDLASRAWMTFAICIRKVRLGIQGRSSGIENTNESVCDEVFLICVGLGAPFRDAVEPLGHVRLLKLAGHGRE